MKKRDGARRGAVLGLPAPRARELMAEAVERIRSVPKADEAPGRPSVGAFTRQWLRDFFAGHADVTPGQADALVHSFWRTVHPLQVGYGVHQLPGYAPQAVKHRDWRLTSGQLSLPECIGLYQLLAAESDLPPGLADMRARLDRALRALNVPVKLWKG